MGELSSIDAFLELLDESKKPAVEGECMDRVFGDPKRRAMSLISFELESKVDLSPRSASAPWGESDFEDFLGDGGDPLGGEGDQEFFTFSITKDIDNATPQLFKAYCEHWTAINSPSTDKKSAGIFAFAKVTLRKSGSGEIIKGEGAGRQIIRGNALEYLIFEFKEVWIKSWELSGKDGDELPEEEIEFAFNKGGFRYYPQTAAGAAGRRMESGEFDFRASANTEE